MKKYGQIIITACAVVLAACSSQRPEEPVITDQIEQPAEPTPQVVQQPHRQHPRAISSTPKKRTIVIPQVTSPSPQPPFKPKTPGRRVAQVNIPEKCVALTFDDGPSRTITPKILDILSRHGAKATFFVVGENAVRNKGILARAADEGHEIASHTWSHIKLTSKGFDQIASEMDRTSAVIQEATGRRPHLMRPPYGATNRNIVDFMMERYGMTSVLWDVDTVDWKHPGTSAVINRAVMQAHNGSIILLHDIHASTLAAVEGVITGLQNRGFRLVTVSQLIRMGRNAAQKGAAPEVTTMANTLSPTDTPSPQPPAAPESPENPAPNTPEQPQENQSLVSHEGNMVSPELAPPTAQPKEKEQPHPEEESLHEDPNATDSIRESEPLPENSSEDLNPQATEQ